MHYMLTFKKILDPLITINTWLFHWPFQLRNRESMPWVEPLSYSPYLQLNSFLEVIQQKLSPVKRGNVSRMIKLFHKTGKSMVLTWHTWIKKCRKNSYYNRSTPRIKLRKPSNNRPGNSSFRQIFRSFVIGNSLQWKYCFNAPKKRWEYGKT
jgi:hypothetical protein